MTTQDALPPTTSSFHASTAGEPRRTLLQERPLALPVVVRPEARLDQLGHPGEVPALRRPLGLADCHLARRTVSGALAAMARASSSTRRRSVVDGHDPVDQADALSASAASAAGRRTGSRRPAPGPTTCSSPSTPPSRSRGPSRAAGMPNWLPSAAMRMSACSAVMQAAADAVAPDHGDDRLLQVGPRPAGGGRGLVVAGAGLGGGTLLAELGDVGAGHERLLAGAGDHDDPHVGRPLSASQRGRAARPGSRPTARCAWPGC